MCIFFCITLTGCFGDSNVELVKNGTLSIDESTTIAQAFEGNQFHQDSEWNSLEDAQGRIIVEYKAKLNTQEYSKEVLENDSTLRAMYGIRKDQLPAIRKKNASHIEADYFLLVQFTLNANKDAFNISYIGLYVDDIETYRSTSYSIESDLQAIYSNQPIFESKIFIRMYGRY